MASCTATSCSRAMAIPRSRSSSGRRSWRSCVAQGLDRDRRRPGARPLVLRALPLRPRRIRRRAAQTLQRGSRRIARQLQRGQVRLRPERHGRRYDGGRHPAARQHRPRTLSAAQAPEVAATGMALWARRSSTTARAPRRRLSAAIRRPAASATGGSRYSTTPPTYARCSRRTSSEAGGRFAGKWKDGRAPAGKPAFAVLESPPLYDIVRDVNKLSNNVMARQVFLTLATAKGPPPATVAGASGTVKRWLAAHNLKMPELVLDNGSGLSRNERISAGSLVRLLIAADASPVRDEFASSLAVAATDGTLERRFQNGDVAGQGLLKTGTLEGARAIAGYVIDGRRSPVRARGDRQSPQREPRAARARLLRRVDSSSRRCVGCADETLTMLSLELIAEAKIAEAARAGAFDNLPGVRSAPRPRRRSPGPGGIAACLPDSAQRRLRTGGDRDASRSGVVAPTARDRDR